MRIGFYINSVIRLRDDVHREPEPALIAGLAEASGAQVILAGWTSSPGLLNERDLYFIRDIVHGDLIIVAPLTEQCVEPIIKLHPERVILVASGWDGLCKAGTVQPDNSYEEISSIGAAYRTGGVSVSLFVDPEAAIMKTVARSGAMGAVLDCAEYGNASTDVEALEALNKLADASFAANKFGLIPSAAHRLNYRNIGYVAALRYIEEVYIGRAVVSRSVMSGLERAMRDVIDVVHRHRTE